MQGDDTELDRIWRQLDQRVGALVAEALLAQAADDTDNGLRSGDGISFSWVGGRRNGLTANLAISDKDASA